MAGSEGSRRLSNLERHEDIQTGVEGDIMQIAEG
jgi:hypothetical protein